MTGTSQAKDGEAVEQLLKDSNLKFNFGQISVSQPASLSQKAQYYRSRDGLSGEGETQRSNQPVHSSEPDEFLSELDNF